MISSSVLKLLSRYSSSATSRTPTASPSHPDQRQPRTIRAVGFFRHACGVEQLELLADLPALEIGGNRRFLFLREEALVHVLKRLIIPRQFGHLRLARGRRLHSRLIIANLGSQPFLIVLFLRNLAVEQLHFQLQFSDASAACRFSQRQVAAFG